MDKLNTLLSSYELNLAKSEMELLVEVPQIYKELIQVGMLPDEISNEEELSKVLFDNCKHEFVLANTFESLRDDLFVIALFDNTIAESQEEAIPEYKYIGTQIGINFEKPSVETSIIKTVFDSVKEVQELVDVEGTLAHVAGTVLGEKTSVGSISVMAREDMIDAIHEMFPNSDGDVLIDNIPEDCTAVTMLITVSKEKLPYPVHGADIIALYEANV